jgi:hypothetical protein
MDGRTGPERGPARSRASMRVITGLRALFLALLASSLLFFGSKETWPLTLNVTAMSVLAAVAALVCGEPRLTRPVFRTALMLSLLTAGWIVVQATRFPETSLAHPVWAGAQAILGSLPVSISAAPAITLMSLLWGLYPLLTLLTALVLFDDDRGAGQLMNAIGWSGGVVALFSIGQFLLYPDTLILADKRHYLSSLTGPFVNRNTAGTYFGLVSVVLLGLATGVARTLHLRRVIARWAGIHRGHGAPEEREFLLLLFLLGASLVALFLTQSRGGVGASVVAMLVLVALLATAPPPDPDSSRSFRSPRSGRRTVLSLALGIGAVLAVAVVFAGRAGLRVQMRGIEDERFCMFPRIVDAARDHLALGAGFGAFEDVFAAYRDPVCGVERIWDRAHNSYLEAVVGLGLPFVLVAGAAVVALIAVLVTGLRTRVHQRYVPAVGIACLVLVAVHGLVDFSLQIPGFAVVLVSVLAAAATVSRGRVRRSVGAPGVSEPHSWTRVPPLKEPARRT